MKPRLDNVDQNGVVKMDVLPGIALTPFAATDVATLVRHLDNRAIYEQTLRLPYPYTTKHAEEWLAICKEQVDLRGRPFNLAIRRDNAQVIGACGFQEPTPFALRRVELGYWLAEPYWGRGIMTATVRRLCRHLFEDWGVERITANVFTTNPASARVLAKCGFEREGLLHKHVLKDGRYIDVWPHVLLREE